MMFLNPIILAALAAAAIPLLLHLLNLRKLRTVDFSSLRFLKELQKTRIRRLKLKQILLLLLRTGLIVFAVLAFARPVLQGSAALPGTHAATTAVILVDNSYSMEVRDERGPRLKQARQAATEIVEMLEDNDEAWLLPMTELNVFPDAAPTRNREALRNTVADMGLGYNRADLDASLRVAALLLDKSGNLNREVYVITDAQKTNAQGRIDSLKLFNENTRVYLMPIGNGSNVEQANLGLDSISVVSAIFEPDKPVEIRAWVRNYGNRDIEDAVVAMHINGARMAQANVTVAAGESEMIELSAPPKRSGLVSGYIEIEGDDFDSDNRRYFSFRVLEKTMVALVGERDNIRFAETVLGLTGGAVSVQAFLPSALPAVDLSRFSAVILADIPAVSSGDAARLQQYVQGGGGLVIYGGAAVDRNAFGATLGSALGISIGAVVTPSSPDNPFRFGNVEKDHPIFTGVFDVAKPGQVVESPNITRALPAANGETIIRLTNGAPFMSEYRRGKGRAIYIAVPPTTEWSDIPTKGIFVPIIIRTALYVSASGEAFEQVTVGEQALVQLPGRMNVPDQVMVVSPDGNEAFIPVRRYDAGASIAFDKTTTPGVYTVKANGEEIALFTANMGSGESNLEQMEEGALQDIIAARMETPANLFVLDQDSGGFAEAITESRVGLELWKYMLVLALLCAVAEMIVGRAPKSEAQPA